MTFNAAARTRLPADWGATGPSSEELVSLTEEPVGAGIFVGLTPAGQSSGIATNELGSRRTEDAEEVTVIKLPTFRAMGPAGDSFGAMQEWEGIVTNIEDDVFRAELFDITAGENEPNEIAEIPIEDIQPEDIRRLRVGATFRWLVGYAKTANGIKTRGFRIHFREPAMLADHDAIPDIIFKDDRSKSPASS